MVSLQGSTPEQWQEIVGLCQRQVGQLRKMVWLQVLT